MRLAINPLAWTNDDMPEPGAETLLETCLAEARQAGFVGVEPGHNFPRMAAAPEPVLAHHGLALASGGYGSRLLERDVDAEMIAAEPHIALLSAMGCEVMAQAEVGGSVHGERNAPLSQRPMLDDEARELLVPRLDDMARRLAERGLRMACHHHTGTVIQATPEIERPIAASMPDVGLLLDTGHQAFAGGDPAAVAQRHAARIVHLLCKDMRVEIMMQALRHDRSFLATVLDGVFTVPGNGGVDVAPVFAEWARARYRGWLVVEAEQDPAQADPPTFARMGHDHVAALAAAAFGRRGRRPPRA